MTRKAETQFYSGVNTELLKLQTGVYYEKMYNPLRGGTPDMYYEHRRMLWVEYKYAALPLRDTSQVSFETSDLQLDWLKRNHDNGHEPWVIVGTHDGRTPMGVILTEPREWRSGMKCGLFRSKMLTRKELAQAISDWVHREAKPKKH